MVHRWASASNRRRVAEELATVLASTLVAIVAGIGILRLPDALRLVGLQRTDAWPSDATLQLASAIVVGGTLLVVLVRAIVRYRRRRTNALALARVLDRKHQTADLIATAIAVECGDASGNAELSVAVTQRAAQQLPAFGKPVVGFRAPATSLAALGIAAALVALIPLAAEADADGDADATAADDAIATPPLSAETLERLQDAAQMLARFEHKPGLKDSAREKLAQVRQQLDAIEADPDRSLSTLSKAEQALRELAEASRNEELFDEEKLGGMSSEELAEQMTRSLERGETDTAAAMAEEMARRLEDADEREMRSMARALERALERTPPSSRSSTTPGEPGSESSPSEAGSESSKSGAESGKSGAEAGAESGKSGSESGKSGSESGKSGSESGKSGAESGKSGAESGKSGSESGKSGSESGKSGSESGKSGSASSRAESGQSGGSERREAEDRARWRNKAEGLSERLRSGDSGTARSELEKMAEEMGKRAGKESMGRSLDRALSEVRKARSKQLSEMNGEGSSGKGEGEGKQGKGEGKGEGEGLGEGAGEGEGSAPGDGDGPPRIAAPFGPPSGKPGPGGGDGADDTKGDPTSMPEASAYAPERVQTDPDGPAQGAVRVIRRFTEGYHDSREYGDLHDKYSSIAESAVRQEEIPLTRRDYIRSYFQAVRGQ